MPKATADIGLIGLAVMGQNLVLNMNDHGFTVAVFNRTVSKVDEFLAGPAQGTRVVPAHSLAELAESLKRPRRVMLMVKAGAPVDEFIEHLLPVLEKGDIIIDGGNSNFGDTARRMKYVESKGLLYVGTGVSGGEEGARNGPSIMPGGSPAAWEHVKPIFQAIAAKVDGAPCCEWVGQGGAGHYVKMVHNGIEYGDMQLICEAYSLMRSIGMAPAQMSRAFAEWNQGDLDSYLIQITSEILAKVDDQTGRPMVDVILDAAGQKGTGKWTVISACDLGVPVTLIAEAVLARCLSAAKEERVAAAKVLPGSHSSMGILPMSPTGVPPVEDQGQQQQRNDKDRAGTALVLTGETPVLLEPFLNNVRDALYASKICSYAQGFQLMRAAAAENHWDLNYGGVAMMWRGGCIIRSRFLGRIKEAFDAHGGGLVNLLLAPYFTKAVQGASAGWRRTVATAVADGVPVPAFSSALAYYDGYRSEWLPANLLQAQRDYFGAHTYERVDKPRGQFFHTNWTGEGGTATSGTYTA
jgi:6-phosphogluconate dehydrogenase